MAWCLSNRASAKAIFIAPKECAVSLAFLVALSAIVLPETRGAAAFPITPASDGNSARFDSPFGAGGAAWQRRKCCLRSFRANHCRRV
jgi:hypothetical protein